MIETLIAQQPHGCPCGVVKIDIDAVVAALMGEKVEALVQLGHQPLQLLGGRRATAQMKLLDPLLRGQVTPHQVDLPGQGLQIGFDGLTVRAQAGRHLHIQR
ncbi:hypothetical protein D9M71_471580 [compost metagenome]